MRWDCGEERPLEIMIVVHSVQSSPTVEVELAVMVGIWYCGSITNINISLGIVTCAGRVWWPSSPVPTVVSR